MRKWGWVGVSTSRFGLADIGKDSCGKQSGTWNVFSGHGTFKNPEQSLAAAIQGYQLIGCRVRRQEQPFRNLLHAFPYLKGTEQGVAEGTACFFLMPFCFPSLWLALNLVAPPPPPHWPVLVAPTQALPSWCPKSRAKVPFEGSLLISVPYKI